MSRPLRVFTPGLAIAIAMASACTLRDVPRADSVSARQRSAPAVSRAAPPAPADTAHGRDDRVVTDSTLLQEDLDGSGAPDRLVRQVKFTVIDRDTVNHQEQFALYLDSSTIPAWSSGFDEFDVELARPPIRLASGGSLVVIHWRDGDADIFTVLDVHAGRAREVLQHQIDYGHGSFAIREDTGRVTVTATAEVKIGGETRTASVACPASQWAALLLTFDEHRRAFAAERQECIPQE